MKDLNKFFDKIFVITIPSFSKRIDNMKQRLDGVDYEFFYGAYGGDLDVQKYRNAGSRLTRGQLSCALSHYMIYEKMVNENIDNVLILEDDCAFNENINNIGNYLSQIPDNYSVFYLGYDCPISNGYSENLIEITKGSIGHTHSMNVRKKCAEKILEINKDLLWTADGVFTEYLNKFEAQIYLANPKLTYQDNDGSTSTLVEVDIKYGMGI